MGRIISNVLIKFSVYLHIQKHILFICGRLAIHFDQACCVTHGIVFMTSGWNWNFKTIQIIWQRWPKRLNLCSKHFTSSCLCYLGSIICFAVADFGKNGIFKINIEENYPQINYRMLGIGMHVASVMSQVIYRCTVVCLCTSRTVIDNHNFF